MQNITTEIKMYLYIGYFQVFILEKQNLIIGFFNFCIEIIYLYKYVCQYIVGDNFLSHVVTHDSHSPYFKHNIGNYVFMNIICTQKCTSYKYLFYVQPLTLFFIFFKSNIIHQLVIVALIFLNRLHARILILIKP